MTKTITQTFSVSHEYRISFTKSLFNTSNTMLPEILKSSGTGKSVKTVVVMDDGVAAHHPLLTEEISAFFTVHAASLSLCAAPLLVTGGEATTNSLTDVEKVLH